MDPQVRSCHNPDRPARGRSGLGDIRTHSRAGRRYRCTACGRTFAGTRGTPPYRLTEATAPVTIVRTRPCHGGPLQARVAAIGRDARTVAAWRQRAGRHGPGLPGPPVLSGQVAWGPVRADGWYVEAVARGLRMAMAMAVPSRPWPGGVRRPQRDLTLIMAAVRMVRAAARGLSILVCVAGQAGDVTAFTRVSRDPERTGRRGRPRLVPTAGLLLGQVIAHRAGRCLTGVPRRVVRGTEAAPATVLVATGTGTGIETAPIARLNAPFRGASSPLTRRGRATVRDAGALAAGMDLVGCAEDSCWAHDGPRAPADAGQRRRWRERPPAMAAGLPGHGRTMREWLSRPIPLPPWVPPKRRGRPPKRLQAAGA